MINAEVRIKINGSRTIFNIPEEIKVEASCVLEDKDTGYIWWFECYEVSEEEAILHKFFKRNVKVSKPLKNKGGKTELFLAGKKIKIPTGLLRDGYYYLHVILVKNYNKNKNKDFGSVPERDVIGNGFRENILLQ